MFARDITRLPARAEEFLRYVAAGNEDDAMAMLAPKTRGELPRADIIDVWSSIIQNVGQLEGFTDGYTTHPKGTTTSAESVGWKFTQKALGFVIAATWLEHEAGRCYARIAFNRDDAIVGLLMYIEEPNASELPF